MDCLVTGYEFVIPTVTLPDINDRHVLAGAIHLSDFPAAFLKPLQIEAIHPDGFVGRLWDEDSEAVLEAVRLQRAGLKNPHKSVDEYLETLERCQVPRTAALLRAYTDRI